MDYDPQHNDWHSLAHDNFVDFDFNVEVKRIEGEEEIENHLIVEGITSREDFRNEKKSRMNRLLRDIHNDISNNIREQIDEIYAQEKKTDGIFNIDWENEIEVLDAIEESRRLRNKNFEDDSIEKGNIPIRKEKVKKKKRFIFF